ncbi:MAG: hypothetical protein EZS28_018938 [Streblomastix strix]|uniref:Uncharacterized protein n=1 Tax=Streblomastix strix TaxID=222440 RepID=A0A5J4VSI4_9EUKA|nr:MAG: hypothetical protein EZS28_018938 [Streblomastix strix]
MAEQYASSKPTNFFNPSDGLTTAQQSYLQTYQQQSSLLSQYTSKIAQSNIDLRHIQFTLAIQQTLVSVRAQQAFTSAASAINNSEIIELMNSAVKQEERILLRDVVALQLLPSLSDLLFATPLEEIPIFFFQQLPSIRLQQAKVSKLIYGLYRVTSAKLSLIETSSELNTQYNHGILGKSEDRPGKIFCLRVPPKQPQLIL